MEDEFFFRGAHCKRVIYRWSLIAGQLPGRTDNEIKNYWNTHIRRKLLSRGIDPQTHKEIGFKEEQPCPSGINLNLSISLSVSPRSKSSSSSSEEVSMTTREPPEAPDPPSTPAVCFCDRLGFQTGGICGCRDTRPKKG